MKMSIGAAPAHQKEHLGGPSARNDARNAVPCRGPNNIKTNILQDVLLSELLRITDTGECPKTINSVIIVASGVVPFDSFESPFILWYLCILTSDVVFDGHHIRFGTFFGQPFGEHTFSKHAPKRKFDHHVGFSMPDCLGGEQKCCLINSVNCMHVIVHKFLS